VRDLAVHRHDHDQHAAALERDELDPLQQALGGRRPREADVLALAGQLVRGVRGTSGIEPPCRSRPRCPGPAGRAGVPAIRPSTSCR
jgi:hypothetical protein